MTNRNELIEAFLKIAILASKIDKNQQKVNMMHFMHGRADDAHHWQSFVDNQRERIASMTETFNKMTANLKSDQVNEIKMEAFNRMVGA